MNKILLLAIIIFTLSACAHVKTKPTPINKKIEVASEFASIASACKDPKGKYQPVSTILSKGTYNAKEQPYKPMNGFIEQDFNHDKKLDFLFLERLDSDIRLITCFSKKNRYQRNITPFKVHETVGVDFQTISESISVNGSTLVLTVNRHEHNWGSDSEISHYTYHSDYKDFVLEQLETISSSGDGYRSDTEDFYDVKNKRFKRSSVCGGMEEGCKPYKEAGTLMLPKVRSTLLKPKKAYTRLIAD